MTGSDGASPKFPQKSGEFWGLKAKNYTPTQLRYDLRKMKAHGLIERDGKRYAYRLTSKGNKTGLLFVLHKCVSGPLANSLFNSPPATQLTPATRLEEAYRQADQSIQHVLELFAVMNCERKILRLGAQDLKLPRSPQNSGSTLPRTRWMFSNL